MTPEEQPLELFGAEASATVARALDAAGIEFIGAQQADVSAGTVWLPGHSRGSLSADRIVSLPLARGPRIPGVPATGLYGLIPVDPYGRVDGLPDAYATGDATDFPIKQGGIACQQADAVAAHIAARHGAAVAPTPFEPSCARRCSPETARRRARRRERGDRMPAKLPGRYLAPYLQSHAEELRARPGPVTGEADAAPRSPAGTACPRIVAARPLDERGAGMCGASMTWTSMSAGQDRRDAAAERRDVVADERDGLADVRERAANEREAIADERERNSDTHEPRRGGERGRRLRERARLGRAGDALLRIVARLARTDSGTARDQTAAERENAASRRPDPPSE